MVEPILANRPEQLSSSYIYIRVMDAAGNAEEDELDCLEGDNTLRAKIFHIYIDIIVYREYG
jgi:hypothetical protein